MKFRAYNQISDGETRIGIEFMLLQPHLSETIENYVYSLKYLESQPEAD